MWRCSYGWRSSPSIWIGAGTFSRMQQNHFPVGLLTVNWGHRGGGFSATSSAAIIQDYRILSMEFSEALFGYCPREANQVAHELAKNVVWYLYISRYWGDDPPVEIIQPVVNDITMFDIWNKDSQMALPYLCHFPWLTHQLPRSVDGQQIWQHLLSQAICRRRIRLRRDRDRLERSYSNVSSPPPLRRWR